jgi:SSS family solute:Na+ symporter
VNNDGDGVLSTVFLLYYIFSGGIAGMFLLGVFTKRANKQGLFIGILASVVFTGYAVLTSSKIGDGESRKLMLDLGIYNYTHHKMMLGVYSHIVLFVVGYLASLFFKSKKDTTHLTYQGYIEQKKIEQLS